MTDTEYKDRGGRPSIYSDELAATICERLAEGESLRSICRDEDMPCKSTVLAWLSDDKHAGFRDQYAYAHEMQADHFHDEIIEIADETGADLTTDDSGKVTINHEVVARSRLRVDTRKWLMARLAPKKYGDRLQHTGDGGGAIRVAPDLSNVSNEDIDALERILGRTADA